MAENTPIAVITTKELADYLRVHPSTVYKLVREGKLPAVKIGSDLRFIKNKIDEWMADLTQPT